MFGCSGVEISGARYPYLVDCPIRSICKGEARCHLTLECHVVVVVAWRGYAVLLGILHPSVTLMLPYDGHTSGSLLEMLGEIAAGVLSLCQRGFCV